MQPSLEPRADICETGQPADLRGRDGCTPQILRADGKWHDLDARQAVGKLSIREPALELSSHPVIHDRDSIFSPAVDSASTALGLRVRR